MSDVRTIEKSEIADWVRQMGAAFHFEVAAGYPEYFVETIDLDRAWASFDGDRIVGTLRSFANTLTVPGLRVIPASALTNVSVAPTHRRQGRLTEMMESDLQASVDRGEPLGILIAAEYPIYGRYGYGPAADSARYTVFTKDARFREPPIGSVVISDRATLRREGPALYDRFRREQPGSIERDAHWWDRVLRQVEVPGDDPAKGQVALYRSDSGELEGYVIYEAKQEWDGMRPQGSLNLQELLALSPSAYHALWSYCFGIDLLVTIDAGLRPTDEVLPYLLVDGRSVKLTGTFDFVWVRILDVCTSLEARIYTTPGRLVIDVVDLLGHAQGRFALDGGPDGATCRTTTESADLEMSVDALGSLYLGGVGARTLELGSRVDELRPGAIATADTMFRTSRAPWCTTWF